MALKLVIISGSQTGVERTALDWAIKNELPHGGWCPAGLPGSTEALAECYKLKETATDKLLESVENNVRDSDGTVVFTLAPKAAGPAQKAVSFSKKQKKPVVHLHRGILGVSEKIVAFLDKYYIRRLHISGSQEELEAGIGDWVAAELEKAKVILERRPE